MRTKVSKTARCRTRILLVTKKKQKDVPDFEGKKDEIAVHYERGRTLVYCGLGKESEFEPYMARTAAANGVRKAIGLKRDEVSVSVPELKDCRGGTWQAVLEGALLGAYKFEKYIDAGKRQTLKSVELVSPMATAAAVRKTAALCDAVNYTRDLVNDNASVVTPAYLANEARRIGQSAGMRVTVLDEKAIDKQGLGLLKAVGQGSPYPPRLILAEYNGNPKSKKRVAVVGKGITFDSGGQNLKPSNSIGTMRSDMAGAAVVLGVMKALGTAKPKVNVVCAIAAAQNAIDGKACFPGDVHRSYSGKTVEIANTDAEGRLILADALAYCIKKHKPTQIIDLATLTGGIVTALSRFVAGLFTNNAKLGDALFEAGERTRERLWRFPMYEEYLESIKSDRADIQNLSKLPRGEASSIIGAAFLKEFVGETPWAHLDIAGVAHSEGSAQGEKPQFASGFGVRLLMDYLQTAK